MTIINNLFIKFCMIYDQKGDLMPILHSKIRLCFCYLFQLFMRLLHQKHKIFHQSGYIQHFKWLLTKNIQISKLDQFSGFILKNPLSTHLTNPMVATSVVTYTFYIGQIWWRPWSGWGTSVDWGGRASLMIFTADQCIITLLYCVGADPSLHTTASIL